MLDILLTLPLRLTAMGSGGEFVGIREGEGYYVIETKNMTDLSIIIVSYKGWERLSKCLESLDLFTGNRFKYEVIIVDNNSCDDTIYEIEKRFSDFRFIHNKVNGGYANGNNLGSKYAKGEFLLILNPDTKATETEIEKLLIAARSNPTYSVVSCRQTNENRRETNATGLFPEFWNLTGFQRSILSLIKGGKEKGKNLPDEEVVFPDWISGSVIMMRKESYQQLNGFYEGFWMYYEDVDLCRRVKDNGGKVALFPNITIEHNHGGSSRINLRTTSITKTEVQISRHLYISRNMKGTERALIQTFLVINNLISDAIMAIIGIIFFFIPKIFIRTVIYIRLINYYIGSIFRRSWISPRAVSHSPQKC
jgi:GT2 family glycosyltransferase